MNLQTDGVWEKALKRLMPLSHKKSERTLAEKRLIAGTLTLSEENDSPDAAALIAWIDACLAKGSDQVAARNRAATLGRNYMNLDATGRARFLLLLVEHYSVNDEHILENINQWLAASPEQRHNLGVKLRDVLDPPRMKLLSLLNSVPEGVKFLVDMRADVIALQKELPSLKLLDADLKRLLNAWFDIGLLNLEEITWEKSSAHLLEKLIAYEAVHEINGWTDLKNRLRKDRRCYTLFHPSMPKEPLIFVEVALTQGLATSVDTILSLESEVLDEASADTAIFYSISNAQKGLSGISFGNYLIKSVVALLQKDLPAIKQFSTLSPIPGFRSWLQNLPEDSQLLSDCSAQVKALSSSKKVPEVGVIENLSTKEQDSILVLASNYLAVQKRNNTLTAKDSVAHFHLSNGSMIAQLNWLANKTENGLSQSFGLMVNYLYDLKKIENNINQYSTKGHAAHSSVIRKLLK